MDRLQIAVAGGVPASLGGGGLELQASRTAAALAKRGHEVFDVAGSPRRPFDLLHAFSSGPDVAHWIEHWRRNDDAPFVLSPVVVVAPGPAELRQRVAHRLALPEFGPRRRRELLRRADAVIALTEHEARLLKRLGGRRMVDPVVIGNGADALKKAKPPTGLPSDYVVLLGSVSERKRQRETVLAIAAAGGPAPVVVGGFEGSAAQRARFEEAISAAGAVWLREVDDQAQVRALLRDARALVHLSRAEGQSLAIIEALSEGTPVIASRLPANGELAGRYPRHVEVVGSLGGLTAALRGLGTERPPAPKVPTWDDVAARLERVYTAVR